MDDMYKELKNKIISKPILGGIFNNSTADMLEYNNNKKCSTGYYINTVLKNGPLDLAGIKEGDIVISEGISKVRNKSKVKIINP